VNTYDFHYSGKLYRDEALRQASKHRLIGLARADCERPAGLSRVGLALSSALSLLRTPENSG
jgi:hypothetical protein